MRTTETILEERVRVRWINTILRSFLVTVAFTLTACTTPDDQLLSPAEANERILAAYAARDYQCGTGHSLTIPIYADADREDVEACVYNILAVDCSVWSSSSNIPVVCLAIQLSL